MVSRYGNVALVTGASSGIGKATAELLSQVGFHVYGTTRKEGFFALTPGYEGGFVKMVTMDVTSEASVEKAVALILENEPSIDILVNCAGVGIAGAVEDCSAQEVLWQMDTNYLGVIRVLRAVLPGMRERRRGLIINLGSVAGIFSVPFQTSYSSSKFAVAALTDGLRMELKPFGVKASLILPGDTKTGFTDARVFSKDSKNNTPYFDAFARAVYTMEQDEQNGDPPERVAKLILKTIFRRNPPICTIVNRRYKWLTLAKRLMPNIVREIVVNALYSKPLPKGVEWRPR
jgi:short-subunit dehydrogenase